MPDSAAPPDPRRLPPDAAGVGRAASLLAAGRLVAFPTETVYGLGADACNGQAVLAVYAAKRRPRDNPLIVHVADAAAAAEWARFHPEAERLASAFWPGPLTLVLPRTRRTRLAPEAAAGLATVAVRVPAHPVARSLLAAFGGPVVGPSANPSGRVSATEPGHVLADFGGSVAAVLDGGAAGVGVESCIVGFHADGPVLLREGGIPRAAVETVLGRPLARPRPGAPRAPGAAASHYAPAARLRIDAAAPEPGEAWLGFGREPEAARHAASARNLSPAGDVTEAASRLFACLRELDAALAGAGVIAVAAVPERGLGAAVNDRLRRAAAPRTPAASA